MRRALRLLVSGLATLAIAASGVWGALFLWFQTPGGPVAAGAAAAVVGAAAIVALWATWRRRPVPLLGYGVVIVGLVIAYNAIRPRNDRDWAPDVARPATAEISGDRAVVHDVRAFDWRTETDAAQRWETRTYDLAQLDDLDLINSYWSGRAIAHTLLSFGFRDGRHLVFSVEIRRERDEEYSNLAGFFKRYELITIAADERDIVRLRTTLRREDVELYRIKASPAQIRALFVELLRRANSVAATPAFYNSLRTNCTTVLFGAVRAVAPDAPFDWRIILSGYLPNYAYDQGVLDTRLPFAELHDRARVSERGRAAGDSDAFSARIRDGVPDPNR